MRCSRVERVPIVVRRKDDRFGDEPRQEEYEVVGECYVHGMMSRRVEGRGSYEEQVNERN